MSDCNSVKCGECIPLFNYYVNQQEAIFNEDAVITPECPQGYICENNDPVVIPAGTKKIIPDVPTYDPNLNPDCDYLCEMDLILDTTVPQFGMSEIGNSAITVRCKDIGGPEEATGQYTVPGNLFVVSYDPALKSVQQALAEANQLAWDYGKVKLQELVLSGDQDCCAGWDITQVYPLQPSNTIDACTKQLVSANYVTGFLILPPAPGYFTLMDQKTNLVTDIEATAGSQSITMDMQIIGSGSDGGGFENYVRAIIECGFMIPGSTEANIGDPSYVYPGSSIERVSFYGDIDPNGVPVTGSNTAVIASGQSAVAYVVLRYEITYSTDPGYLTAEYQVTTNIPV